MLLGTDCIRHGTSLGVLERRMFFYFSSKFKCEPTNSLAKNERTPANT